MIHKRKENDKESYIFEILLGFLLFGRKQFNGLVVSILDHNICSEPKVDNAGIDIELRLGVNSIRKIVSSHHRLAFFLLGFQMLNECQRLLNLGNLLLVSQAWENSKMESIQSRYTGDGWSGRKSCGGPVEGYITCTAVTVHSRRHERNKYVRLTYMHIGTP